jgi:hypothetical protein
MSKPDEIQPTMRKTVAWLQELGYDTVDSGDGVLNVKAGMEGALDFPHVAMVIDAGKIVEEAQRLLKALIATGIQGGKVEANYDPADGLAIMTLMDVTDRSFPGEWHAMPTREQAFRMAEFQKFDKEN